MPTNGSAAGGLCRPPSAPYPTSGTCFCVKARQSAPTTAETSSAFLAFSVCYAHRQQTRSLHCFCAVCSCFFPFVWLLRPLLCSSTPAQVAMSTCRRQAGDDCHSKSDRLLFQTKRPVFCLWLWFVCNSGHWYLLVTLLASQARLHVEAYTRLRNPPLGILLQGACACSPPGALQFSSTVTALPPPQSVLPGLRGPGLALAHDAPPSSMHARSRIHKTGPACAQLFVDIHVHGHYVHGRA